VSLSFFGEKSHLNFQNTLSYMIDLRREIVS